jgi:hypothetical protein
MLSYLLHLLQLLNVAYFALLKRSYSNSILALAHNYIYYISKETFLLAFKAAYCKDCYNLYNIAFPI